MAKQEPWRLRCEEERAKRKKEKGGKMFLKEWNQNGVKDWRGLRSGRIYCLKWNGISSLLKIGGRMLRYGFCPIFINEEDLEILF